MIVKAIMASKEHLGRRFIFFQNLKDKRRYCRSTVVGSPKFGTIHFLRKNCKVLGLFTSLKFLKKYDS